MKVIMPSRKEMKYCIGTSFLSSISLAGKPFLPVGFCLSGGEGSFGVGRTGEELILRNGGRGAGSVVSVGVALGPVWWCGFAYYTTGDKPVNIKNIHKDMDIFYVVLNCFSV